MRGFLVVFLTVAIGATAHAQPRPEVLYGVVEPYLGTPYLWGGTDPDTGLDCSAFVQTVYRQLGLSLPRTSRQQFAAFPPVRDQLLPGDLVFFSEDGRRITHVALYLGHGYIAHSALSRGGVTVEPVRNLENIYVGANRPWLSLPKSETIPSRLGLLTSAP